jgi:hypothetical protein
MRKATEILSQGSWHSKYVLSEYGSTRTPITYTD